LEFIEGTTVILSPPDPAVGDIIDVVVLFQNSGRASAPLFYVTFQDILDGDTTEIETLEVRNVQEGSAAQTVSAILFLSSGLFIGWPSRSVI